MGYFPIDEQTLIYLHQSGRSKDVIERIEAYLKAQKLFRLYDGSDSSIQYTGEILKLDLSTVVPCVSGPKRPHDHVPVADMKRDFRDCLSHKVGFKGERDIELFDLFLHTVSSAGCIFRVWTSQRKTFNFMPC